DYSAEMPEASDISEDISSLAQGLIRLCVVGKNALANWQPFSAATTVTWTKDTIAPVAATTGEPSGTNNTTILAIDVANTSGVTSYLHNVASASSTGISAADDYPGPTSEGTHVYTFFSALDGGPVEMCVVGIDAAGNQQDYADATEVPWSKDTEAPTDLI